VHTDPSLHAVYAVVHEPPRLFGVLPRHTFIPPRAVHVPSTQSVDIVQHGSP
jgi:hypothetical protein